MYMLIRSAQLGLLEHSHGLRAPGVHEKNIFWLTEEVGPAPTFCLNDSAPELELFAFKLSGKWPSSLQKVHALHKYSSEKVSVFIWLTWSILYCHLWRRPLDTESSTQPLVSTSANIAFTVLKCLFYISFFISNVAHDILVR